MIKHFDTRSETKEDKTYFYPVKDYHITGYINVPYKYGGKIYDYFYPDYEGFNHKVFADIPVYFKGDVYVWITFDYGTYVIDNDDINILLINGLRNNLNIIYKKLDKFTKEEQEAILKIIE